MKTKDFPAGHSMDTDWFAIDKDGNIGFFDSGQEGAVPIQIPSQTMNYEFLSMYTKQISKSLKQLFLCEETVQYIVSKCNTDIFDEIEKDKYAVDGCVLLLNEGKKWEDLELDEHYAKGKDEFALLLSPTIPLYLLSDANEVNKQLIKAIKNNIIAKACDFRLFWDEEYERKDSIGLHDLGGFLYNHDDYDGSMYPYKRVSIPRFPLNISQFDESNTDNLPYFKNISFKDKKFIQPMEYVDCQNYIGVNGYGEWTIDDTPRKYLEQGYISLFSDYEGNKVYCLLSENMFEMAQIERYRCKKCYSQVKEWDIEHESVGGVYNYPKVCFLTEHTTSYSDRDNGTIDFAKFLCETLDISQGDVFNTNCIKCYYKKNTYSEKQKSRIVEKFQNCHRHLETELSVLQPLLLIAYTETVVNLLKTQYAISDYTGMPCLCKITIQDTEYSLLVVNNEKTADKKTAITNWLSSIKSRIDAILAQPRTLPEPLPRTIKNE
ncbi:MAG: hypothetical protein LBR66_01115 [Candidatus Symbiothrix sp.]|jgi:hypothetical protein|nr:hypothetical protein [Candidatus Symbiothrix sp.]